MACATSWLGLSYKLHCASDVQARMEGIMDEESIQAMEEDEKTLSRIRRTVLEITEPIRHTKRIINTDNYYTSTQLVLALKTQGLYCRGTLRAAMSKHFPKLVVLSKKVGRGETRQAVCQEHGIVAASWKDSSVVNLVSNADGSQFGEVTRQISKEKERFIAPQCVLQYNKCMQGVDRLDQLRARFSIADGHSYKKWHMKLAMAFIDIARCNAFITRQLLLKEQKTKDPHRDFVIELAHALLSGKYIAIIIFFAFLS